MPRLPAVLALVILLTGTGTVHAEKSREIEQTHETRVGELLFLKLPGNPDVGYKWRFNPAQSSGVNLVTVDPIGWLMAQKGRSFFFKRQSVLNVAVNAKKAGRVDLAFDYYRSQGGRSYNKTRYFRINIKP